MREYEKPHRLFVLGAGFSRDAGIPIASDVMSFVRQRISAAIEPDIVETKGIFFDYLRRRDPEQKMSFDELARAMFADRSEALRTLRLGCLKAFWEVSDRQIPEGYRHFVRKAARSLGVVLWNWDVTVERAASEAGLDWTYYFSQENVSIRIVKLHGSLNWVYTPGARPVAKDAWAEPYPEVYYLRESPFVEADPRLILEATPMILPGESEFLGPLWQAAEALLARAGRLVFIGCGFPDYDLESVQRVLRATKATSFEVVSLGTGAKLKLEKLLGKEVDGSSDGFLRSTYAQATA